MLKNLAHRYTDIPLRSNEEYCVQFVSLQNSRFRYRPSFIGNYSIFPRAFRAFGRGEKKTKPLERRRSSCFMTVVHETSRNFVERSFRRSLRDLGNDIATSSWIAGSRTVFKGPRRRVLGDVALEEVLSWYRLIVTQTRGPFKFLFPLGRYDTFVCSWFLDSNKQLLSYTCFVFATLY